MSKKYYLPEQDGQRVEWFQHLAATIDTYKVKYGLTVAEVDFIKAAALYLDFWYNRVLDMKAWSKKVTGFKNEILNGFPAGGGPSVTPADISFAGAPPAVVHGVIRKVTSIVNRIKKHSDYTTNDGDEMKIEGAEPELVDIDTVKPVVTGRISNGLPELVWTREGFATAIRVDVLHSSESEPPLPGPIPEESFKFLGIDTVPNFIDTTPLPPFRKAEIWIYRVRYMIDDVEVGLWSDPVFITVTGV
jgi:hypothetical protein